MSYWVYSPLLPGGAQLLTESLNLSVTDSCAVIAVEPTNYGTTWLTHDEPAIAGSDATPTLVQTGDISLNVSESCAVQASDDLNLATARQLIADDTVAVIISEGLGLSANITADESSAIQVSDAIGSLTAVLFASDTCAFPASDEINITAPQAVTTTDSLGVTASDAINIDTARAITATESCALAASDVTASVTCVLTASESVILGTDDAVISLVGSMTVEDSLSLGATDALNAAAALALVCSDSLTTQATESAPVVMATISVTDDAAIPVSEAIVMAASVSTTETCVCGLTEPLLGLVEFDVEASSTVTEAQNLSLSEAVTLLISVSVSDLMLLTMTEASAVDTGAGTPQAIAATDDCVVQLGESAAVDTGEATTIPAVESCAVGATESARLDITVFVTETCRVLASEGSPVLELAFITTDALAVQATEQSTTTVTVGAEDTLALDLSEDSPASQIPGTSDAGQLTLDEQGAVTARVTVADSAVLGLADDPPSILEVGAQVAKLASDSLTLGSDDLAKTPLLPADVALLLLESVQIQKTYIESWGGGARLEPAIHIYATSVRIGQVPPDQSRGGTW